MNVKSVELCRIAKRLRLKDPNKLLVKISNRLAAGRIYLDNESRSSI